MNQQKDLKKLSRADLLELLVEMGRENDRLKAELSEAQAALEERDLKLQRSGSLAEAALALNGIFEAADAACSQYIENMRATYGADAPAEAFDALSAAEERARTIVSEAEEKAAKEIKRARKRARKITEKARDEATLLLDEAEAILDEAKKKRKK